MSISNVLAGLQPWHIETGNCIDVLDSLPDGCVQVVICSPPYFGLRDYGVDGQIGLEESPDEFIDRLVQVFRKVRRVLRDDGTLWVNMGDSYSGSGVNDGTKNPGLSRAAERSGPAQRPGKTKRWSCPLKPKDLMGMPWRLALALQADGWWLRSDIIWAKPNPMPESVTDRPTKAHEYVFLFAKSERYFYDADAVREQRTSDEDANGFRGGSYTGGAIDNGTMGERKSVGNRRVGPLVGAHGTIGHDGNGMRMPEKYNNPLGRNRRTVWEVATEAFGGAHFATYPTKLVEPCILAGTSSVGACPACGAPWERITEKVGDRSVGGGMRGIVGAHEALSPVGQTSTMRTGMVPIVGTVGWEPGCDCDAGDPLPCIALDIFNGAGTTGLVANRLGRRYIGIELNPDYAQMARDRIRNDTPGEDRDLPGGKKQLGLFPAVS